MLNLDKVMPMISDESIIYCDMDGVLCDFWTAATEISPYSIDTLSVSELWKIVREHPNFWSDLKLLPEAENLWDYVNKRNGQILSTVAYSDPNSGPGKLKWLKKNIQLTDSERIHITRARRDKQLYAFNYGVSNILIDDYHKNIHEWNKSGGVGHLHTNVEETIKWLDSILVE